MSSSPNRSKVRPLTRIKTTLGRRLVSQVIVLAVMASGLPFLPTPLGSSPAAALPGTPFDCAFPEGSQWWSSPSVVSSPSSSGGFTTDDSAYDPSVSLDGRHVSYSSYSSQHVAGDTNASADVFVHDRLTKTNTRASLASGGVQGTRGSVGSVVSGNGRYAAFYSSSPNFLGGDPNTSADFYDAYEGRVAMPNDAIRGSTTLTIEAWFKTTVNGVIIGMSDASFRKSWEPGADPTQWVPAIYVGTDGKLRGKLWGGNGEFSSVGAVNDGRWHQVALTGSGSSQSLYLDGGQVGTLSGSIDHLSMWANYIGMGMWTNWTAGGTGWSSFDGQIDEVSVYRTALSSTRVQQHYQARTNNYSAAVSADAPWGYWRLGDNYPSPPTLAADSSGNGRDATYGPSGVGRGAFGALTVDTNEEDDVFVRDMVSGQLVRVSETSSGAEGSRDSSDPAISADGRYVSFYTDASLQANDTNNTWDVYLRDRDTDADAIFDEPGQVSTTRVSISSSGAQGTSASYFARMSPDARFVVFDSYAPFDPTDTNNKMDVYIRDRQAETTSLLTPGYTGGAGNDASYYPTVSTDGTKVTFYSWASNLVPGDTNAKPDVFVRDRVANTTARISLNTVGNQANDGSWYPSISADGRYVAYYSAATDLIAGDTNGVQDVFVRNLSTSTNERVSLTKDNAQANGSSSTFSSGVISGDGRFVAFQSSANNIVANDTNGWSDVFERDRGATNGYDLSPTLGIEPVAQSDEVGLEQFHSYLPTDLGTGTAYTNLRTGNLVATFEDASVPGQGLNTVVRHVYNSSVSTSDTGVGKGWRLSASDLEAGLEGPLGDALSADADGLGDLTGDVVSAATDLDPHAPIFTNSIGKLVDGVFQATGQLLEFTDGDGTTHRFVRQLGPCGRWLSPPGVSLKIREVFGANPLGGLPIAYELIRPDGVVYRAEPLTFAGALPTTEWKIVSVTDRRGNQLTYQYGRFGALLQKTRLQTITHNRTGTSIVRFDWTPAGDLDKVVTLPGVTSPDPATGTNRSWERIIDFDVDPATKQLRSVTDNTQATPPGGFPATSTTNYGYDANGVLSSVTDGRGNLTRFTYGDGKLTKVTDRANKDWIYGYTVDGSNFTNTTVTSPVGSATIFKTSPRGTVGGGDERIAGRNIVSITDSGHGDPPVPVITNYEWTANRLTRSLNGAGVESKFEYNDLGLLTKLTRAPPNAAAHPDEPDAVTTQVSHSIQYRFPVDFGYAAGKCTQPPSSGPVTSEGACSTAAEMSRVIASDTPSGQRRVTDFQYDSDGNLSRSIQRASRDITVASDAPPGASDRTLTLSYYSRGGVRTVDGPRTDAADVTTWGDTTDPTFGGYDRTGMPTRVTDAVGQVKSFAFTPYGQVGKVTDRDGRVSTSMFDEDGKRRQVSDPSGHQTTFEYDANDRRTKMTLPLGGYATFSYDSLSRPLTVSTPGATPTDPRTTSSSSYFDDGRIASQTSARGAVTNFAYWPNRLVKTVDAPAQTGGRAVADTYYDVAGRPVRWVFPVSTVSGTRPELLVAYNPDGSERSRSETSATGSLRTTRFAYNALGEVVRTDGPRTVGGIDEATSNVLDTFGQPITSRRRKSSTAWLDSSATYDLAGNLTSNTQPHGSGGQLTSAYTYDALNRLASDAVDPVNPGHTVHYGYDNEGNQTSRTDRVNGVAARTITTSYNPDLTVQEVVATDNGTGGTVATCNYAAGALPSSGYDADHNLLTQRTVTGIGGCGGLTTERTLTMSYDDRDWLTDLTQTIRSPENNLTYSRIQSFTYAADGARASFSQAGLTSSYAQSPAGWQESVTDWRGQQSTISYLPSGSPTSEALGAVGPRATYEWHRDGMPKSLTWVRTTGQVLRKHSDISYDVGGFRTSETVETLKPGDTSPTGAQAAFGYDLPGRLSEWTSPFIDSDAADRLRTAYSLDDGGNVTGETVTQVATGAAWESATYSYTNSRLTQKRESNFVLPGLPNQITTTNFSYDGLGEETQRSITFEPVEGLPGLPAEITNTSYDASGHTKTIDDTSVTNRDVTYVYDTGGTLVSRLDPNAPPDAPKATLYFRWGGSEKLVEEADGFGATLLRYLNDDDGEAMAQLKFKVVAGHRDGSDPGTWQWLLRDPSDSIGTVTGDNGTVQEQSAFDPYGKPTKAGSSQTDSSKKESNLGFQGSLTDKATGNLLLASRQYDPTTTRFTTADTFVAGALNLAMGTDSLTGNRYLFAAANPVSFYEDGHAPAWLRSVGRFGKAMLKNKLVRGIAIGVAIGVACGLTAGLGCAVAVGIGAGAVLGAANYAANTKGARSLKGLGKAALGGAVEGAVVGATGAVIGKAVGALKSVAMARIAARAPPLSTTATRGILKTPSVSSTKLQNIVNNLYKGTTNPNRIGTGTTMDAVRYELQTGQQVFGRTHILKAEESVQGLQNWLKASPDAPYYDRLVGQSILDDLLGALGGS